MIARKGIIVVLSLIFAGIAVFGSFGMMRSEHNHTSCFASIVTKNACPEAGTTDSSALHVSTFKLFSTAHISTDPLLAFLAIAIACIAWLFNRFLKRSDPTLELSPSRLDLQELYARLSQRRIAAWQALLEHSPTAA